MKKIKDLKKNKVISIIAILAILLYTQYLPIILVILSGFLTYSSIKNHKKYKSIIFGTCLALTGILAIAIYMPIEKENTSDIVSDTTENKNTVTNEYKYENFTNDTNINDVEQETFVSEIEEDNTIDQEIKSVINKVIYNEFKNTTIDNLRINENMGTDSDDDVIVLVDFSWSTKNLEKNTRNMLEMYSNKLAIELAPYLADGSEIALFWDAEYTGLSIKHSYYVNGGNAYIQ